jgi:TBC1 domain family member 13
LIETKKLRQKE